MLGGAAAGHGVGASSGPRGRGGGARAARRGRRRGDFKKRSERCFRSILIEFSLDFLHFSFYFECLKSFQGLKVIRSSGGAAAALARQVSGAAGGLGAALGAGLSGAPSGCRAGERKHIKHSI